MSLAGFETAIPERERPQTHVLDRATTGNLLLQHLSVENPLPLFCLRKKYPYCLSQLRAEKVNTIGPVLMRE
jgi:hypothetical protein